jgi:hypothetical protein
MPLEASSILNGCLCPLKMEGDFDTGNVRFKARERYSFGYSDPRTVFGSPGA